MIRTLTASNLNLNIQSVKWHCTENEEAGIYRSLRGMVKARGKLLVLKLKVLEQ